MKKDINERTYEIIVCKLPPGSTAPTSGHTHVAFCTTLVPMFKGLGIMFAALPPMEGRSEKEAKEAVLKMVKGHMATIQTQLWDMVVYEERTEDAPTSDPVPRRTRRKR